VAGFYEDSNEPSGFHKESRVLFDKLSNCQLLKVYPAP
jgi:hypothetical protein